MILDPNSQSSSGMKTNLKCNLGHVYTRHSHWFKGTAPDRDEPVVCVQILGLPRESLMFHQRLHGGTHPPSLILSLKVLLGLGQFRE